ncbi:GDSL-type esterase/lipase family protein [Peptostreptococcus faecalis]|uniref:GDSL-type esterase/lipase family protein n=1 Tax=Peptostreptococcus faecalis TaxID=2045015 RepID=UPI001FA8B7AF|nr:GDSL-type esterase/lipase family protein [Peptostreptococcus faecalis]
MKKKKFFVIMTALFSSSLVLNSGVFAADTSKPRDEQIKWTINFLKKQANQNIDDVEEEINKVNKDTSIEKFDMSKAKSRFEDVVFLGDSITEYLKQANILDASSVLAVKGEHVNNAKKHLKEIKNLKPKQIVILYGANDINSSSPEAYKESYIDLIKTIKKENPKVKIYVQAPIPVDDSKTVNKDARINNESVKNLTEKVKEVAKVTGVGYLPSEGLITSKSLYEPDGIHLKYNFYKNWLFYLSENI